MQVQTRVEEERKQYCAVLSPTLLGYMIVHSALLQHADLCMKSRQKYHDVQQLAQTVFGGKSPTVLVVIYNKEERNVFLVLIRALMNQQVAQHQGVVDRGAKREDHDSRNKWQCSLWNSSQKLEIGGRQWLFAFS